MERQYSSPFTKLWNTKILPTIQKVGNASRTKFENAYPSNNQSSPTIPTAMASDFSTAQPPVNPTPVNTPTPIKPIVSTNTGGDPNVRAQQIALNANGAGLKVDGILGPLTMAAIKANESKVSKTPSGGIINPITGGVSESPVPPQSPQYNPPTVPTVSPYETNVSNAEQAYMSAGQITPEEEQAQAELDNMLSNTRLGSAAKEGQGRGIPLELVRGEQAKLEKQGLLLAEPLQTKLARLQAKRTSALETSKFALDRADKALATERGKTSTEPFTLGEGQVRYDAKGNMIAKGGEKTTALEKDQNPDRILTVEEAKNLGVSFGTTAGQAYGTKIGDEKNDKANQYSMEKADRAIALVDEALGKASRWNTGFGALLSAIPESDAKDFGALVESIKANIGFNELSAMRAASPTGGALGQVAVQELNFLQSVLGSLDTKQSPATVKANLEKIKTHFNNWKATMQQAGGSNSGGGVVETTVGPINTNW